MRKEIFYYLKVASEIAKQGENERTFFIGCVGIRASDNALIYAYNGKVDKPNPEIHAEVRACKKLTPGSVLYIARILKSGEFALARPCKNCIRVLKNKSIKKVYFSINNFEFGQIDLNKLDISKYKYREV